MKIWEPEKPLSVFHFVTVGSQIKNLIVMDPETGKRKKQTNKQMA